MNSILKSYSSDQLRVLSAWSKLNRAADYVAQSDFRIMTENGLTPTQFGIMQTLYHKGPLCQKELGEKLLRSGGNITKVIDNLERDGYAVRKRDIHDRRYFRIELTEKGLKKIRSVFPKVLENLVGQFSILSDKEQLILADLCKRLGLGIKKEK